MARKGMKHSTPPKAFHVPCDIARLTSKGVGIKVLLGIKQEYNARRFGTGQYKG